jgi:hypothetical protein
VFHHVGTNNNTQAFENPHTSGEVRATIWPMMDGEYAKDANFSDPARLVDPDGRTVNLTKDEKNASVSVDLKARSLVVSYYRLRHGYSDGGYRLRHWVFEGSNDGVHWTPLRVHENDDSLPDEGFSVAAWKVEGATQAYRHFRIRQTGENSWNGNDDHVLCCAGIELWGRLLSW